ncbi:MAG: DnaD domain protein [Bacilli bacterium]|nr:DnaD domain protein [Bacilli bacterium]
MDSSKMMEMIKDGNIVVPIYLLKKYKELNLELLEFLFLMYLQNFGNKILFDPEKFSNDFQLSIEEVMELVDHLAEKGFVQVEVLKNDKGIMEDVLLLDNFYNKLKVLMVGDMQKKSSSDGEESSVYSYLEQKFGRTLSSIDYEIVHTWFDNNYDEDLIKKAVDEAVANGVSTLKYIDKILYEWGKKGIETVEDLDKSNKINKKNTQEEKMSSDIDLGLVDWDWLDEDE